MIRLLILIISLTFILYSCSDQIVSSCESELQDPSLKATLSSIQESVFTPSCAVSGCHTGARPASGLDLSEGKSYSQLVNVASNQSSLLRVKPEESQGSWLISKLNANGTSVMPPSGKLSTAVIDSIALWIDRGALND